MANGGKKETVLQAQEKQSLENMGQRFTNKVLAEFGGQIGKPNLTGYQRQLIQNYFINISRALQTAEDNRQRKNAANSDHKFDNTLPVVWQNVNMTDLALDVVHYAQMGLDMMQSNHLFPIPYKNNKTKQYDITLMLGYNGIAYIAEKYALDKPAAVTVELVYSTDDFRPIKKSLDNKTEGYQFVINQPFDRGKITGGFGYIEYADSAKNKLVIMSVADMLKRKPAYASAEFWGGTKKEKDKNTGKLTDVETEGWFAEMCLKTLKREVYSAKHMPRDPQLIDAAYQHMQEREAAFARDMAQAEANAFANTIDISPELLEGEITYTPETSFGGVDSVDMETGEVTDPVEPVEYVPENTSGKPEF